MWSMASGWISEWVKKGQVRLNLFLLGHESLDEVLVVDLAVGVFGSLEDDFDFFDSQFLTKSGEDVTDFSSHNGTVTLLVEDAETFNEVLEGSFLLSFGDRFDEAQEFVKVAGLGVHFFLLWVSQNTSDILVGWLEAQTTDKITDLNR